MERCGFANGLRRDGADRDWRLGKEGFFAGAGDRQRVE